MPRSKFQNADVLQFIHACVTLGLTGNWNFDFKICLRVAKAQARVNTRRRV
jgi:hypothetical protein